MSKTIPAAVLGSLAALVFSQSVAAQDKPLRVEVFSMPEGSLNSNSTLISGETSAVLVDVPFLRSDALRLAAQLLENRVPLKTIIVTHAHPDHFFGLDVFADTFPDARVIALPEVAAAVPQMYPRTLQMYEPMIGAQVPRRMLQPTATTGSITIDGQSIELIGPLQGDDAASTLVWVPSARVAIGGDILFDQVHVFNMSAKQRAEWLKTLDRIDALKPRVVVPGHAKPGIAEGVSSVQFTRAYLQRFDREARTASSAEGLAKAMTNAYPGALDYNNGFILGMSTRAAFPMPAEGN